MHRARAHSPPCITITFDGSALCRCNVNHGNKHGVCVVDAHGLADGVCVVHCNVHRNCHSKPDIDTDGIRVLQQIGDGKPVNVEQPVANLVQIPERDAVGHAVGHADPFQDNDPIVPECRGLCGDR